MTVVDVSGLLLAGLVWAAVFLVVIRIYTPWILRGPK